MAEAENRPLKKPKVDIKFEVGSNTFTLCSILDSAKPHCRDYSH